MAQHSLPVPDPAGFSFWKAQIERLGSRNPLDVLQATPEQLDAVVRAHDESRFLQTPFPGKWTPCQIIGHLIDVEWIFGYRMRTTLADPRPRFPGEDQDSWVASQAWNRHRPKALVDRFANLRAMNLEFWRERSEEDLEKTAEHLEAGVSLSLGLLRSIQAGHDLAHLDQLARYLSHDDALA